MASVPAFSRAKSTFVTSRTDDINKSYVFGKQIGQPGQFGYAVIATHIETGQKRAVKVISKGKFSRATDRRIYFDELRGEIEVMQRMDHPNIIKLYDVFETDTQLFIVMELCTGGELFDRIKEAGSFSETDAVPVMRQIMEGLKYLHSKKIAHCDLKPDNFLFVDERKESVIKIIDFGMSKFVKKRHYFSSLRGTPYYIAPEVITGHYNEACDLWSVGVCLFVCLFGFPPFHGETDEDIFAAVKKGFFPVTKAGYGPFFPADIPCSSAAKDLLSKLLTLDTAKRLTAEEALEHPWFTGQASSSPLSSLVFDKLKAFTGLNKLKQGILEMFAKDMSKEEIEQLKKAFKEIDENGDGQITLNELTKAMEKTGNQIQFEELVQMMKAVDVDGSGSLSIDELIMSSLQKKIISKEERLWNAFCKVDLNGDGKITANEIATVLKIDLNAAKQMINDIDANGDGEVDFDEFITMWVEKGYDDRVEQK